MSNSDLFYLAPETNAGDRHYNLVLPVSLSRDQLDLLYDRFIQKTQVMSTASPLHIIAIPNSGIAIATYFFTRYTVAHPESEAWLSIIDPRRHIGLIDSSKSKRCHTILIDNSVKTGHTMAELSAYLDKSHIRVDEIVKLVDYGDDQEKEVCELLAKKYRATVHSLYSSSEIS